MKQLICVKTIEEAHTNGDTQCVLDKDALVTPAAKDLAVEYGMTFVQREEAPKTMSADEITKEDLFAMLKELIANGGVEAPAQPFKACVHPNGLKLVHGDTVKMDVFDTGDPKVNAHFQELVSKDESHMSAGFLEIEKSAFDWHLTYEEIDYVISGTLEVTIDGKKYSGKAGDVLFVPKDSHVIWSSPDHAHIFYTTYPSNWADAE
ncbi:cupin domain-containing protein [Lacticaseibacillus baoqingensis]|uniref:Cupin domain-containing protein n=1 Tax=Lacticaseibacillus baoqingensis TaxID=2486013 RepID=A0ABW4E8W9_9LACO|nr:cupin domain-containing protein [Lacticaseibacillus baoqingensis]